MKTLIVTAHPDDCEIAIGASMTRFENLSVYISSDSTTIGGNSKIIDETKSSICGIYNAHLTLGKFETMRIWTKFQELRDILFEIKKTMKPDIIYCTSPKSLHPDHKAVGEACKSIFLEQTVYSFEPIRSNQDFHPDKFMPITKDELQVKLKACSCYSSQSEKHYFDAESIIATARFYGTQIGVEYAEAFEVIREIG